MDDEGGDGGMDFRMVVGIYMLACVGTWDRVVFTYFDNHSRYQMEGRIKSFQTHTTIVLMLILLTLLRDFYDLARHVT